MTLRQKDKTKSPMASRLSHSPQCKEMALISVLPALSQHRAFTPAWRLGSLVDVGGRPHLSPCLLPFVSVTVTHCNMDYYSLTDPEGWKAELAMLTDR